MRSDIGQLGSCEGRDRTVMAPAFQSRVVKDVEVMDARVGMVSASATLVCRLPRQCYRTGPPDTVGIAGSRR